MPINWQEIITAFVATAGGGGALLAAAAWLIKALISNRLALDTEKFKIEIKASADTEIEKVKSFLTRAARVHERQVDTLIKLYRHLFDAQAYLQAMASSFSFEGEPPRDEYKRRCADAIASARDDFLDGRLLTPPDLAELCERFFNSLFQGQMHLTFAQHPMIVDGLQRAEFWDKAKNAAYQEIPKILKQIERAARDLIQG